MSPTRWSITDINKTLEKLNEMMVGWILLCHNLADMACLQKDIETSWIFVVEIELGTVNTQLTWPGIILLNLNKEYWTNHFDITESWTNTKDNL